MVEKCHIGRRWTKKPNEPGQKPAEGPSEPAEKIGPPRKYSNNGHAQHPQTPSGPCKNLRLETAIKVLYGRLFISKDGRVQKSSKTGFCCHSCLVLPTARPSVQVTSLSGPCNTAFGLVQHLRFALGLKGRDSSM